jgi:hypothetical protein
MDAPLAIVGDGAFHHILNTLVDLERHDHQSHFGPRGCTVSRYRTATGMTDESSALSAMIVVDYAKMACVSLVIDAGIIEGWHFLDMMILTPDSRLGSLMYDSLENDCLENGRQASLEFKFLI